MLIFNFVILIIFINVQQNAFIKADLQECNKIAIEGGERVLKKILQGFGEIKDSINDIKLRNEDCHGCKELPIFDGRIDNMPEKCFNTGLAHDCASATLCTRRSGFYKIHTGEYRNESFYVACDAVTDNGDWLVIQRRQDGSEDFYRDWSDYENGFGDIEGEFFIGLKKLYDLTNFNGPQELLVVMQDGNYTEAYAKYDSFLIGNAAESYKLKRLGKYSGNAGDSLTASLGMKFTTKDCDNDVQGDYNCAVNFTGAWWYKECHLSNPNGKYGDNSFGKGINWYHFRGHNFSLPYIKMMIRRSRNI